MAPPRFDVLVVDALSGAAIAVHLITMEAIDVYLRHLHADTARHADPRR